MTLRENKKICLALIEEYSKDEMDLTEDSDIAQNINFLYNLVYFKLSEILPIINMVDLEVGKLDKYTEFTFPEDLSKVKEIWAFNEEGEPQDDKDFYFIGDKKVFIKNPKGYKYMLEYHKYPSQINEDTPENFELELELKAQMILPVGVAADILRNDPSSNYATFENKYQNELINLNIDRTETQVIL